MSHATPSTRIPPALLPYWPYRWNIATVAIVLVVCMFIFFRPPPADTSVHIFDTTNRPHLGSKGETVVIFYDYQCPSCRDFEEHHLPAIKRELIDTGRMHLVYMQAPILGKDSTKAAIAAHCASLQGNTAFQKFHQLLFAKQGAENHWITDRLLQTTASEAHLRLDAWKRCLSRPESQAAVDLDYQQFTAAKAPGTPQVYVAGISTPAGGKNILRALDQTRRSQP